MSHDSHRLKDFADFKTSICINPRLIKVQAIKQILPNNPHPFVHIIKKYP